jgi:hypothetical protein
MEEEIRVTTIGTMDAEFPDYVINTDTDDIFKAIQIYQDRIDFLVSRAKDAELKMVQTILKSAPYLNLENRVYNFERLGSRIIARDSGPRLSPLSQSDQGPETSHP